jgi:predicted nuclease with TOPRIM domain
MAAAEFLDCLKDDELSDDVAAYRAGQAAFAERIKALEEANAALEEMAGNLQVRMSDMLERLHERYPEDFVWLKEADQ